MSITRLTEAIYSKNEIFEDNSEKYFLLRLANLYGEELLEEYLGELYEEELLE